MNESSLPDFGVCAAGQIIEIVASPFPEAARSAVVLGLEAMADEARQN